MKTSKIMKKLNVMLLILIAAMILPFGLAGQDSQKKEIKLKMIKEKNGEKTVIDTTIVIPDVALEEEMEKLKELLNREEFKSLGLDPEELDRLGNIHFFDPGDLNGSGVYVLSQEIEENAEGNKNINLMISADVDGSGHETINMSIDGDGYIYFFSEDGDTTVIDNKAGPRVVIKKRDGGDESQTVTITDELQWTDTGSNRVEVENTDGGKIIKVTRDDGTIQEYTVEDEGTWVIDEDGEIHQVEGNGNINWEQYEEGMIWVHLQDDGENSNVVVKRLDGDATEINIGGDQKQIIVTDEEPENGESQVFIKKYESKKGDRQVIVEKKVIVRKLNASDTENLKNAGVEMDESTGSLEIDHLSFNPNPNSGKFTLEFETPGTGTTEVRIYDSNGREVYSETITNFEGTYNKQIDISSEESGIYFLRITQGDKASARKIILE